MPFLNSPLVSILLVFFTYAVTGWRLASASFSPQTLWLVGISIALINLALNSPFQVRSKLLGKWLQSDTKTLLSFIALILVTIGVFLLTWMFIFIQVLLMISALTLASLDLQVVGFKKTKCFLILTSICLSAYSLGISFSQFA